MPTPTKPHRTSPKRYEMLADELAVFKLQLKMRDRDLNECWIWDKSQSNGYGYMFRTIDGTRYSIGVHRLAYYITYGEIPEGHVIDHMCHNEAAQRGECESEYGTCEHRLCFNPTHLRAVTQGENQRAGIHRTGSKPHEGDLCMKGLHPWNDENKMISGTTARGGKVYPKVRCRSCVREWNARYRQAVR